jgi:hypothetical protein
VKKALSRVGGNMDFAGTKLSTGIHDRGDTRTGPVHARHLSTARQGLRQAHTEFGKV